MPCYILGAISYLLVARLSDAHQQRGLYQVIAASVCIIGYGISISESSSAIHYFATYLIACGLFVAVGIPLAWLPSNNPRYGKRTTASAIQITICNCSGIVSPFVSHHADWNGPNMVANISSSAIPYSRCPAIYYGLFRVHCVTGLWHRYL